MKSLVAALRSLVLPWGRTSGRRIVLDGESGVIDLYGDNSALVVVIDSDGYRLYNPTGDLVAQITLDAGQLLGGFYTRNFVAPANTYAFLSGGQVTSGPVTQSLAALHGYLQYVIAPGASQPYAAQTLSTGAIDLALDDEARLQLISQRGQRPVVWVDGGSSAVAADLLVTGKISTNNIRSGAATTPAPPAGGGTTTVAVTFSSPMDAVPRVQLTPQSTVDPGTTTIVAFADSVTKTGFTIRCYRSTNSTSSISYLAVST